MPGEIVESQSAREIARNDASRSTTHGTHTTGPGAEMTVHTGPFCARIITFTQDPDSVWRTKLPALASFCPQKVKKKTKDQCRKIMSSAVTQERCIQLHCLLLILINSAPRDLLQQIHVNHRCSDAVGDRIPAPTATTTVALNGQNGQE